MKLFKKIKDDYKLGAWTVSAALYNDEVTVEHNWKIVQSVFADRKDIEYHTRKYGKWSDI